MKKLLSTLIARPWIRAQLCTAVIGGSLFAGSVAYAKHRAKTLAEKLGSEVLANSSNGDSEAIEFNGARFFFAAKVLEADVDTVLSRAEELCEQGGKDLDDELGPLVAKIPDMPGDIKPSSMLTIRGDKDQEGEVGCWARREGMGKTLLDRIAAFTQTSDLAEFGSLQYVHAEQVGKKTLVRVIWSQGPLAINSMFPSEGDTPGRDLEDLPRPPNSNRILAAHIEGQDRHVVGYASPESPALIAEFYAKRLSTLGWSEVDLGNSDKQDGPNLARAYQRNGDAALLSLAPDKQGASVTWVHIPRR